MYEILMNFEWATDIKNHKWFLTFKNNYKLLC